MKASSECWMSAGQSKWSEGGQVEESSTTATKKTPFRLVPDDTKPLLRDPILRSDPIETEQAVLRLPPFPVELKGKDESKNLK